MSSLVHKRNSVLRLLFRRIVFLFFSVAIVLGMALAAQAQDTEETASIAREDLPDKPEPVISVPPEPSLPAPAIVNYQGQNPEVLTFRGRLRLYVESLDNPGFLTSEPFDAAFDQAENSIPEWGQGWGAYGKRLGSDYAQGVGYRTLRFGVSAVDGELPLPYYTDQPGFWPKIRHGIKTAFVSNRSGGGQMPAYSRMTAIYGTQFVANAWYPPQVATAPKALERGTSALAQNVGYHIGGEFWHAYSERLPIPAFIRRFIGTQLQQQQP